MIEAVLIGSSTGGPAALYKIINRFPEDFEPPIIIAQHIPPTFEESFADVLKEKSLLNVFIIEDGMRLEKNRIYLTKGGYQTEITKDGIFKVYENTDPDLFSPSINITFLSFAKYYENLIAIILSGLSTRKDGIEACKILFNRGDIVIIQNEKSSVVYGMQKNIKDAGFYNYEVDLIDIPDKVLSIYNENSNKNVL